MKPIPLLILYPRFLLKYTLSGRYYYTWAQWLVAFQRSLGDFLPVLSLPGEGKVAIIDYITKIVGGALSFGLLIIAFRRKFERKYTRWSQGDSVCIRTRPVKSVEKVLGLRTADLIFLVSISYSDDLWISEVDTSPWAAFSLRERFGDQLQCMWNLIVRPWAVLLAFLLRDLYITCLFM